MGKAKKQSEVQQVISFVKTLKFEGLALSVLMVVLTWQLDASAWFLVITFLLFDVSMAGYALNKTAGAVLYNAGHNTILPTALLILGIYTSNQNMQLWSYAWLFHVGIDRFLGFGLKHRSSFKHTHLGRIH